jgi:Alcohol dehydrogenase GroES-like domain
MRAAVMFEAGDARIEDVPDAGMVEPTDAVLRVTRACVCGSDLWPYQLKEADGSGQRMGHEAIGVVEEVGPEVRTIKRGDVVVMPLAYSDGTCALCHEGFHRLPAWRVLRQRRRGRRRRAGRGGPRPATRRVTTVGRLKDPCARPTRAASLSDEVADRGAATGVARMLDEDAREKELVGPPNALEDNPTSGVRHDGRERGIPTVDSDGLRRADGIIDHDLDWGGAVVTEVSLHAAP